MIHSRTFIRFLRSLNRLLIFYDHRYSNLSAICPKIWEELHMNKTLFCDMLLTVSGNLLSEDATNNMIHADLRKLYQTTDLAMRHVGYGRQ